MLWYSPLGSSHVHPRCPGDDSWGLWHSWTCELHYPFICLRKDHHRIGESWGWKVKVWREFRLQDRGRKFSGEYGSYQLKHSLQGDYDGTFVKGGTLNLLI